MISCDYKTNMADCMEFIDSFLVFKNGKKQEIKKNNKDFEFVYKKIEELFYSSRVMPAFGVSLHSETLNALKQDAWLQINFNKEMNVNGLLFSSLLFKLEKTNGINLIRLFNNKYEGRCIFLDLDNEMDLKLILNTLDRE